MTCSMCGGSGRIYYYLKGEHEVIPCDHIAEKKVGSGYSEEQLRRKAHFDSGGTLANYDRSHYTIK
jgi:hypothetical protein